jgi:hypothetical protein
MMRHVFHHCATTVMLSAHPEAVFLIVSDPSMNEL